MVRFSAPVWHEGRPFGGLERQRKGGQLSRIVYLDLKVTAFISQIKSSNLFSILRNWRWAVGGGARGSRRSRVGGWRLAVGGFRSRLKIGHSSLVTRHSSLVTRHSSLVGLRSAVCGGRWAVGGGRWAVGEGRGSSVVGWRLAVGRGGVEGRRSKVEERVEGRSADFGRHSSLDTRQSSVGEGPGRLIVFSERENVLR
jgi:hypothetical protein